MYMQPDVMLFSRMGEELTAACRDCVASVVPGLWAEQSSSRRQIPGNGAAAESLHHVFKDDRKVKRTTRGQETGRGRLLAGNGKARTTIG